MKVQQRETSINVRASPSSDGQGYSAAQNIRASPVSDGFRRSAITMRLATWNIGSLTGRSQELAEILHRRKINICCIQELRWKGSKSRNIGNGYQLLYHGSSNARNGVGIIVDEQLKQRIISVERRSDRIISLKIALDNQPCLNVISVYAPQTGCTKEEKTSFWEDLQEFLQTFPTCENKIIAGDLNGHVGRDAPAGVTVHGNYGYGHLNDQGKEILELANIFSMPIVNTLFKKKDEHLITYKSGTSATQIDYFLCNGAIRSYFKDCKVIPGEPLTTQHRLLVACLKMPLWNTRQKTNSTPRIKWYNLQKEEGISFASNIAKYQDQQTFEGKSANALWDDYKKYTTGNAKECLGISKGKLVPNKDPSWWNDDVKEQLAEKKERFKKWQKSKDDLDRENYVQAKKKAKKVVAKSRAAVDEGIYNRLENAVTDKEIFKIAKFRNKQSQDIKRNKYIKNSAGTLLTSDKDINERWLEYYSTLLNEEFPHDTLDEIPPLYGPLEQITADEVKRALSKTKNGKAVGPDEIPSELLKMCGTSGISWLTSLFNLILSQGKMPDEWRKSNLIPFYKNKGDVADCGNYRAIKLTSHALKIWEIVIANRIVEITEITPNQCGFTRGVGTTDAIHTIRILMEKYKALKKDLHLVFVDLEKAFDRVPRKLIWQALRAQSVPEHYILVLQDMYNDVKTKVVSPAGISEEFEVKVGVHQGSTLSPLLFNIVMNYVTKDLQKPAPWTLLYADDIVLIAETMQEVQSDLTMWCNALERRGLRVSKSKTEYMHCNLSNSTTGVTQSPCIGTTPLKAVSHFKYLGSVLASDASVVEDIESRINTGWLKWRSLTGVICDPRMPVEVKGNVYKRAIRPALLYGSECWPMRKSEEQKLHVTEMKMLRWSGGVTLKDKVRNEHIRGTLKVANIADKLTETRLRWYGHVMRREKEHMTRYVMDIEEPKRGRGRPPTTWMGTIRNDLKRTGLQPEMTQMRPEWRRKTRRADPKRYGK